VLTEPAVIGEVFLFELGPPSSLFLEDLGVNVFQAGVDVFGLDVEVFLPVVSEVVEALLEVLAAVVQQERHHALLVDRASTEANFLRAGFAEEYKLPGVAIFLVGATLATGRILGGPGGTRVAGDELRCEYAATGAVNLVRQDGLDRLYPVDVH